MKKNLFATGVLVIALASSACGVKSAVDSVQAAAEKAAKQAKGQAGLKVALKKVSGQVVKAALSAGSPSAAPAFSPEMAINQTININDSATVNGATFTTKGTVSVNGTFPDSMTGSSTSDMNETMNLTSTWSNLSVTDGTKTYKSSGNMTVTGSMSMKMTMNGATMESMSLSGKITEKGTMTLDADSFDVDITVTITSDGKSVTISYTGTLNGDQINGSETESIDTGSTPPPNNTTGATNKACNMTSQNTCIEYTGSSYSDSTVSASCGQGTVLTACPTANRVGRCTFGAGTASEYINEYYTGWADPTPDTTCANSGGTWAAN